MELNIYNSLTNQKEKFEPITPGEVKMYVCGPTVYDRLHIGNFVGAIVFNMVRNWLEKSGYKVTYVYNYTDVDDKIIQRANDEKVDSSVISEKYIAAFEEDFHALGLKKHTHNPRVTEHMDGIISMISSLIANEHAYVVDGEVLYDVASFESYGALSKNRLEDLQVGARVEVDSKKKHPYDFVLWKPAKAGEPFWESPWGEGRPGWHIECSAMIHEILGVSIDIHGGGKDLKFPHHECEIAQAEGCNHGQQFVKYWMHNEFLSLGSEKMSKSLGNVMTTHEFIKKYNAEILKYMILSTHYRTENEFSDAKVSQTIKSLARIYSSLALADDILNSDAQDQTLDVEFSKLMEEAKEGAVKALNDDFNTPELFARVFEVIRAFNSSYKKGQKVKPIVKARAKAFKEFVSEYGQILAMFQEPARDYLAILDDMLLLELNLKREEIDQLIVSRKEARDSKDWAKSDEIRDKLLELGISIHDTPQGTSWEVTK